jgi:BlaI family transcriptional regulator, penicillinase repressor
MAVEYMEVNMDSGKGNVKGKNEAAFGELTEAEWAIMKVVWEHQPCAAGTVQEALAIKRGWAYSTVKTTMDRMADKGLLKIKKVRNVQLFSPQIDRKQAAKGEFRKMLSRAFDGAMTPMMQFMLDSSHLSRNELDQLEAMIKSKKEKSKIQEEHK